MRTAEINRNTAETKISLSLNLDGKGTSDVDTGVGFLNHMLTLFAKHGRFDLMVKCDGDTDVDDHHSVEDIGICLGKAFLEALGERKGIVRYGDIILPMDETLVLAAVDISGRGGLFMELPIPTEKIGTFDSELCEEFFRAFTRESGITLHLMKLAGTNSHHIVEAAFKATARSLKEAVAIEPEFAEEIPSTKGIL